MEDIGFGKFEKKEKKGKCGGCGGIFTEGRCENRDCSNAGGPLVEIEPSEVSEDWVVPPWATEVIEPIAIEPMGEPAQPKPQPESVITKKITKEIKLEDSEKRFQPVIDAINSRLDKWITAVSRGKEEIPTEFFVKRKAKEIIETEMSDYVILKKGTISESGLETILKNIKVPEIKGASELLEEILREIKEKIKKEGTQGKVL